VRAMSAVSEFLWCCSVFTRNSSCYCCSAS